MKRLTSILLLLLALVVGSVAAAPAWPVGSYQRVAQRAELTLDQAAELVRRETGGRILSAETIKRNGQRVHRIKVLTPDHRVVVRELNADGR